MPAVILVILFAQFGSDPVPPQPERPVRSDRPSRLDPRTRRAEREACVARVGDVCRPLVESWGQDAVDALNALTPAVGKKLSEFHTEGNFAKLPDPREILKTIKKKEHGDEVAEWVIKNVEPLSDPDAFHAFLGEPLEYVMELKKLSLGATEFRARRLAAQGGTTAAPFTWQHFTEDWRNIALAGAGIGIVVLLIWMNRRRPGTGLRVA